MEHQNILHAAQASTIYSAMCALNNVGATLSAAIEPAIPNLPEATILVSQSLGFGEISVSLYSRGQLVREECYPTQSEFALVYGLGD